MADRDQHASYDRDAARARLAKRQANREGAARRPAPPASGSGARSSRGHQPRASEEVRARFRVIGGRAFDDLESQASGRDARTAGASNQDAKQSLPRRVVSLLGRHPRIVVLGAIALLLVICVGMLANACSARQASKDIAAQQAAYEQQGDLIEGEINLPASLDPQIEKTLKTKAQSNGDVDWIIRHTSELSVDGDVVLKKLLKLTATEDTAVSFVRNFPEKYPQQEGEPYDENVKAGVVPLLMQWDERWGYTVYSSTAFALTGCCPTCLSMVYMGLTGKNDMTPYDMGVLADEMGYMDTYNGTLDDFLLDAAQKLGLTASKITVSSSSLSSALKQGQVVICNVGAGDFTDSGHYLVITGCTKDGELTINDPFSKVNSDSTWDIDQVISQTKGLWAYSA